MTSLCHHLIRVCLQQLEEKDDDSGDSGIIIIFSDPDDVHTALGLGNVANIVLPSEVAPNVPVLQQGKLKAYLLL